MANRQNGTGTLVVGGAVTVVVMALGLWVGGVFDPLREVEEIAARTEADASATDARAANEDAAPGTGEASGIADAGGVTALGARSDADLSDSAEDGGDAAESGDLAATVSEDQAADSDESVAEDSQPAGDLAESDAEAAGDSATAGTGADADTEAAEAEQTDDGAGDTGGEDIAASDPNAAEPTVDAAALATDGSGEATSGDTATGDAATSVTAEDQADTSVTTEVVADGGEPTEAQESSSLDAMKAEATAPTASVPSGSNGVTDTVPASDASGLANSDAAAAGTASSDQMVGDATDGAAEDTATATGTSDADGAMASAVTGAETTASVGADATDGGIDGGDAANGDVVAGTEAASNDSTTAMAADTSAGAIATTDTAEASVTTGAADAMTAEADQSTSAAATDPAIGSAPDADASATDSETAQVNAQTTPPASDTPAQPSGPEPTFDLVRVETDGAALIAGVAAPGAVVQLLIDGTVVGEETAGSDGKFVAFLDIPPSEASRVVTLRMDGVVSSQDVILGPTPGFDGSSDTQTVLLSDEEGVSVLQSPAPQSEGEVTVQAISYAGDGAVDIAGQGSPGSTVRAYLGAVLVGEARVGPSGAWSLALTGISGAAEALRLDEIAADGSVASRIEVPFDAGVASAPAPQVASASPAQGTGDTTTDPAPSVPATGAAAPARSELADIGPAASYNNQPGVSYENGVTRVTVIKGSTLWAIAREKYGEGLMYVRVFDANRDLIRDPDLIYPGQVFDLPD